jgi:adenine-specific DNA methylase
VKFFITAGNEDFLRGLATELHENRIAVHKEWNNLGVKSYIVREEQESKIFYRAKKQHTFFSLLQQIVRKCIGFYYIIEAFVSKIGEVQRLFLIGDHTKVFSTGAMELVIEGRSLT